MNRKIFLSIAAAAMAVSVTGCAVMESFVSSCGKWDPAGLLAQKSTSESGKSGTDPYVAGNVTEMEMDGLVYEACEMAYDTGAVMNMAPAEMVFPDWNTEEYKYLPENGWMSPTTSPFSTFAADVDTASYANVRRMLLEGREVPEDAVRIEEMINYFGYDYPQPEGEEPFSVTTEIAPCPWNESTQLLMIGLKAGELPEKERTGSNLVFLIDVSGSMDEYNKLPLVQRAFRLLADELDENDTISIVTYAASDEVVLDGARGDEKTKICDAIEDLFASGGTNGSQGILTAYDIAERHFIEGGNNRVILATDGDLNIGMTDEGSLTRLIREKAGSGVFLSVLGFGEGNISDTNMEALADNGNGVYSYIDSISEARKVLIDEAGGTLFTVAKDVKLQVEFNPERVKGYRLIGYENRTMAAEDFADDTKDGGEIGSGHSVTGLYEVAASDSDLEIGTVASRYAQKDRSAAEKTEKTGETEEPEEAEETAEAELSEYADEWAVLHIRYKEPDGEESTLLDTIITDEAVSDRMSDDLSWASGVAQAGMLLSGSEYAGTTELSEVKERLKPLADDEFREEFIYLMNKMA